METAHTRHPIGAIPISSPTLISIVLVLFKESWLFVADNTNIRWIKIFQLYKGFRRKSTKLGFFIKGSARVVEPPRIEYKGFKYKYSIKGDIARMLIIRSPLAERNATGNSTRFEGSGGIVIKKRTDTRSRFLNGPISACLRRKKFQTLFKKVVL